MIDLTPMEEAESRLTDAGRASLSVARSMFMFGEISQDELSHCLRTQYGFNSQEAEEYLNSCCDANDGDPAEQRPTAQARATARLASPEPVEQRRPLLRPNYGQR